MKTTWIAFLTLSLSVSVFAEESLHEKPHEKEDMTLVGKPSDLKVDLAHKEKSKATKPATAKEKKSGEDKKSAPDSY
jgi:hypothetical protein